jgi:WD40 repeat protein
VSNDGNFLATGGRSGCLRIYDLLNHSLEKFKDSYNHSNVVNYLRFIDEVPRKTFSLHQSDIIDICWSYKVNKYF